MSGRIILRLSCRVSVLATNSSHECLAAKSLQQKNGNSLSQQSFSPRRGNPYSIPVIQPSDSTKCTRIKSLRHQKERISAEVRNILKSKVSLSQVGCSPRK